MLIEGIFLRYVYLKDNKTLSFKICDIINLVIEEIFLLRTQNY